MEYEESWCCIEAEQDTIWDKAFLYKRNTPHKTKTTVLTPEEEEMDIPF